ncbi:HNH endonuclease [Tsukamurella soli]|uniref:HNH endonuclease n=1 Tax=Tsukamurella soli TaxID=644556 RepID=UPI0036069660
MLRRYVTRDSKVRLHQPVFRSRVLLAYEDRCAVCALGHRELLDAAHIDADSDGGAAAVANGLALCKIHHAAYDSNILGITPDHDVKIRVDLLEEVDGPMLKHGLQERHNQPLMVIPRTRAARPDRGLLAARYERFLIA